ncbi:transposase [Curtobacterium flaccumfaciens]|uniref:transposase n=1 Tax=Curtobacterium flaccumfaciens TaxID=2035 RepID=UPI0034D4AF0D
MSGHSVADVASRLGISIHSLHAWRTQCANSSSTHPAAIDQASELRQVKSGCGGSPRARHP